MHASICTAINFILLNERRMLFKLNSVAHNGCKLLEYQTILLMTQLQVFLDSYVYYDGRYCICLCRHADKRRLSKSGRTTKNRYGQTYRTYSGSSNHHLQCESHKKVYGPSSSRVCTLKPYYF